MYIKDIAENLAYIEDNLGEDIVLEDMAKRVGLSPYHYHRIFSSFTGETLGNYIRRRRLTMSAKDLLKGDDKIIDIALRYNFGSQEAFTRSFTRYFGITPAKFRSSGNHNVQKFREPITKNYLYKLFKNSIMIKPKIVHKDSFTVVGLSKSFSRSDNIIPNLWDEFNPRQKEIENRKMGVAYGICLNESRVKFDKITDDTEFVELVGVEVENVVNIPEGMVAREFGARTYAVFEHRGYIVDIQKTYRNIYTKWAPSQDKYLLVDFFDFELYDDRFDPHSENSVMEIWVPIVESK